MITTLIENQLKLIDQATFQKLMNHLLWHEELHFVGSPGSATGKNKTSKGTPDSFFEVEGGYVFCEYTTKEKIKGNGSFFKKLEKDIDHCFSEIKTGIPKNKIQTVLLAFTAKIDPGEYEKLRSRVEGHNVSSVLKVYSIQELPFAISRFPGLAEKYIPGVKTSNDSIYTLHDFVEVTSRGLQPSLANPFIGRAEEIERAKAILVEKDILVITGSQGVGKSKLAVQLATLLEQEMAYEPRIVISSPVPLWDDLKNFVLPGRKYIVMIDDGNKALPNLEYLLHFLRAREAGSLKIIVTVRDYVRGDIEKKLFNHDFDELLISRLDDAQIKSIVQASLPDDISLDPLAVERIQLLAKGNARIALMATATILKSHDFRDLYNAETLYDLYFKGLASDVALLKSTDKIIALGIVSFFGIVDKDNHELKNILAEQFEIDWDRLWESFLELERFELVDIYSGESVKVSDQVLATYGFYKAFIDPSTASISYAKWISFFLEKYDRQIQRSFADAINTFGFKELKNRINSVLREVQNSIADNDDKLLHFFECFWCYRDADALQFVKNWIHRIGHDTLPVDAIDFKPSTNAVYSDRRLDLLANFWYQDSDFSKQSIELGLIFATKTTACLPDFLKRLIDNFSFHRDDYHIEYARQVNLIEALSDVTKEQGLKEIFDRIFLGIADIFLECESTQIQGAGDMRIGIYTFQPPYIESLRQLRRKALQRLLALFDRFPIEVITQLNNYSHGGIYYDAKMYADEQDLVGDFLVTKLSKEIYDHCKLVVVYRRLLLSSGIDEQFDYHSFVNSEIMGIASLILFSETDPEEDCDESVQIKRERIKSAVVANGAPFVDKIIDTSRAISSSTIFPARSGTQLLLTSLAELNPELFIHSLGRIARYNLKDPSSEGWSIVYALNKKLVKADEIYRVVSATQDEINREWKLAFFSALDRCDATEFYSLEAVKFFLEIKSRIFIDDLAVFDKFSDSFQLSFMKNLLVESNHTNFVTLVVEILLNSPSQPEVSFGRHPCEKCLKYFDGRVDLLKRLYFHQIEHNKNYDYHGDEFAAVSSKDHFFPVECLKKISASDKRFSFRINHLNMSFVWGYEDYADVIDQALELIISVAPIWSNSEHTVNSIFNKPNGQIYRERMLTFINSFISRNRNSIVHLKLITNVIVYSFGSEVLRFFGEIVRLNKDIEVVKTISFERSGAYSGSRVPHLDQEIGFINQQIEVLKSLPDSIEYADHISYLEQRIDWVEETRKRELRKDFKELYA